MITPKFVYLMANVGNKCTYGQVQTEEQLVCACEAALMYYDQSVRR
jgi:hypothetical protein